MRGKGEANNEGPERGDGEANNEGPGRNDGKVIIEGPVRGDGEANNEGPGRGQATPQEGPEMTNDRPCRKGFPLLGIGHETENTDCAVRNVQTIRSRSNNA